MNALERICIQCGIKNGIYRRGCHLALPDGWWSVCLECSILYKSDGSGWGTPIFCRTCAPNVGVAKRKSDEHHVRKIRGMYVAGMRRGKQYRLDKGRRLRLERNKANVEDLTRQMGDLGVSEMPLSTANTENIALAWPRYRPSGWT